MLHATHADLDRQPACRSHGPFAGGRIPWGRVLGDGGTEPGVTFVELDPARRLSGHGCILSLTHDPELRPMNDKLPDSLQECRDPRLMRWPACSREVFILTQLAREPDRQALPKGITQISHFSVLNLGEASDVERSRLSWLRHSTSAHD